MVEIEIVLGDITKQKVQAIVNATNSTLVTGGGSLDVAIQKAAGPGLLEELKRLRNEAGGCPLGEAVVTSAYRLPYKKIIHTAQPVYMGGNWEEAKNLRDCYRNSLLAAHKEGLESIAFPAIATGACAYPLLAAAEIAVAAVKETLMEAAAVKKVLFVCFDKENFEIYKNLLG